MAEQEGGDPAANQQGDPQGFGERMDSLESRVSQMLDMFSNQQQMLQTVVETHQRENVESSSSRAAPRGIELESGVHQSGAAGRTAGSTGGDTLGFGVSDMRVGSRGVVDPGLNPRVSDENRSSVPAVNFGSVDGTVGGALGSQSSVPPTTSASEWWGKVASGNTLIPAADSSSGESLGGGLFKKVPKAPEFIGTDVSYPSWSQNFLLKARHYNLSEPFTCDIDIKIADVNFDLTPWVEKGYSVGVLRQHEIAWWFLFDCLKKDSHKNMARQAGSPYKAFRALKDHFLPLSQSQIRVQEEKLKSLRMRPHENPTTFFSSIRETLGVLTMLEVTKDDREVCNLMLEGLSPEYKTLRETLVVFCSNDPSFIETKVRERYLDLQAQGGSKKQNSVALVSRPAKKKSNFKKHNKQKSNSESDSSKKSFQGRCYKCGEVGHMKLDCKARIIPHPSQTGKPEADENESGEQCAIPDSDLVCRNGSYRMSDDCQKVLLAACRKEVVLKACDDLSRMWYDVSGLKCLMTFRDDLIRSAVSNDMILKAVNKARYVEDWYADTGTSYHMTDSLSCMRDLKPCHRSVNGIGGVSCEVAYSGTLDLVFVTADSEFSVELKNVLYSPNLGYNLFSPSAEFDGESWNGLGGPNGVMTAFNGQVTFQNFDGMLIASAYRLGEASVGTVLAALTPANPKHETTMDINDFHNIYAHSHEGLLRTTAKRLDTKLVGDMHACSGCSMSKAIRKGIVRETKTRSDKKLGRVFVDLGGRKDIASVGGKHYPMIVKDDFTRRAWLYFLKNKSDAGSAFRSFLASVRADGVPSLVEIVRSDNGGEFFGGEFASVCNELLIKQEFTPAYSPQYNGVAERGLGLIEEAAMAARIQAKVLFGHVQLPKTDKLWAEAMHWACEAMNHTACSANPESKSPYEMWYGEPRPARPYPFLKPAYCRWQRPSKLLPKGESCFYVGPSRDHPRDCHRVLTRAGTIQETRDVTWEVLPSQLPPLQPSLPIEVAEEGGEDSDDDVETEIWPLVGRGVAHTLLKRDAVPSGAGVEEVESVGAGSIGPSFSVPSSPAEPSAPVNISSGSVAPSVSSPVNDGEGQGGQESGEVEMGDLGGDDEVESMGQGGHDDEESIGSGGLVEAEASPPAARRPRHVAELADFNTSAREND